MYTDGARLCPLALAPGEALLHGEDGELDPVRDAELLVDPRQVVLDRVLAQ